MNVSHPGALGSLSIEERLDLNRRLPAPSMRRAIRTSAGISGAELAADLGVSRQALAHWERGTRYPRPARLRRYVEVLELIARTSQ